MVLTAKKDMAILRKARRFKENTQKTNGCQVKFDLKTIEIRPSTNKR